MSLENRNESVNFFQRLIPNTPTHQHTNTSTHQHIINTLKKIITILVLFVVIGCRNNQSDYVMNSIDYESGYKTDTIMYPLLVEGGTKLIYQVGHMTPDKGLKLYYDTMPYPATGLPIDESLRRKLSAR